MTTTLTPAPPTARRLRRRRRPSGAPPPLPRSIGATGKVLLVTLAALLVFVVVATQSLAVQRATERVDAALLRRIADLRVDGLTTVLRGLNRVLAGWPTSIVGIGLAVALVALRRWRHLFTFLGSMVVLQLVGELIYDQYSRPRPFGVEILAGWTGWAMPSAPVAVAAVVLVGVVYTLVVPGRARAVAKWAAAGVLVAFAFSRPYLGVDRPSDVLVGYALAVAVAVCAHRVFTPNEAFPVGYRRGKTAHLDITGRREEAIERAVRDQLGLEVLAIKPVGLAGSGGSTPLRLQVAGDPDTYLFGKLFAMSHVRSDRWYKVGRTILYGRLEDEAPFQSVRRLVEYEDYALRLFEDSGIPTATAYGVPEITPEREYLLVTQFFDGAHEIGEPEVEVDDHVIDEGLRIVRELWDSGIATATSSRRTCSCATAT